MQVEVSIRKSQISVVAQILTEFSPTKSRVSQVYRQQDQPATRIIYPGTIGEGVNARTYGEFSCYISNTILSAQLSHPVNINWYDEYFHFIDGKSFVFLMFQNQFFIVETPYPDTTAFEEAVLQVKKFVYAQNNNLKSLQQEVETMERISSQQGV